MNKCTIKYSSLIHILLVHIFSLDIFSLLRHSSSLFLKLLSLAIASFYLYLSFHLPFSSHSLFYPISPSPSISSPLSSPTQNLDPSSFFSLPLTFPPSSPFSRNISSLRSSLHIQSRFKYLTLLLLYTSPHSTSSLPLPSHSHLTYTARIAPPNGKKIKGGVSPAAIPN